MIDQEQDNLPAHVLKNILALQLTVAWAGEALAEPSRLTWWRTDLVDPEGGGDLFERLTPKTARWAALEAARAAATLVDQQSRANMANADEIRTLFFWGFDIDEQLADLLRALKLSGDTPERALELTLDLQNNFSQADFQRAMTARAGETRFKVGVAGREVKAPADLTDATMHHLAWQLASALVPIADHYPMPFFRVGGAA